VKDFSEGNKPLSAVQITNVLEVPIRLVREILYELVRSGIVSEICDNEDTEPSYQPARNIDSLTIKYVIDRLEHQGSDNIPVSQSKELEGLSECLQAFDEVVEKSPANRRLKDI
jgi:membrane protein